jgi:hypothetical protein
MSSPTSKNNSIIRLQAFIAGLRQHQAGATVILGGVTITVLALIVHLEGYIAQFNATTAAHNAWQAQVKMQAAMVQNEMDPELTSLKHYLEGIYGPQSSILADYGLKPHKPYKRTLKSKVTAAEKDAATRVARDTMGPREKEAVHGTVAVSPRPEPAPAASTPSAVVPAAPIKKA